MKRNTAILLGLSVGAVACVTLVILLAVGGYFWWSLRTGPNALFRVTAEQLAAANTDSMRQAEQELTDWARDDSGARSLLGDRADEVFRQVDQTRAATFKEAMQPWTTTSKTRILSQAGEPAKLMKDAVLISAAAFDNQTTLPLRTADSKEGGPGVASIATALGYLSGAPGMFADTGLHDKQGNISSPPVEISKVENDLSMQLKFQPKLTGSQLETEVEMVIAIEKNGVKYEERSAGNMRMNLCPDAKGEVPLELNLRGAVGAGGAGTQWQFKSHAVGYVDDEANLSGYDVQAQAEMAAQPGAGERAKGEENQYLEWNMGYKLNGFHHELSITGKTFEFTRASSKAKLKFAQGGYDMLSSLSASAVSIAFILAEVNWQGGYCVVVQVPELGGEAQKVVETNSQTPFTAIVRHKFEDNELKGPAVAYLASGALSIDPSGSKVPAPATFVYTAPEKSGERASIGLESRSKRGIGKLTVTFTTGNLAGWKVDETISSHGVRGHYTGLSCGSPYGPWEIKLEGTHPGGTSYGRIKIPLSEDGKATATFEAHVRLNDILGGSDTSGISNAVIIPNSGGYQINFGTFEMLGTCWGPGVSVPCVRVPIKGLVFNIIPAKPGECRQP